VKGCKEQDFETGHGHQSTQNSGEKERKKGQKKKKEFSAHFNVSHESYITNTDI
jgi:hypothetical protein